jgi:transposase
MLLTPGNTNDHKAAVPCLDAMPPSAHLIADKGYDSATFRDWLRKRGTTPVIPPRKSRKVQYRYDKALYRQRNVIERMFGRLKDFRRIATRFDRNITSYFGALCLIAALVWWA